MRLANVFLARYVRWTTGGDYHASPFVRWNNWMLEASSCGFQWATWPWFLHMVAAPPWNTPRDRRLPLEGFQCGFRRWWNDLSYHLNGTLSHFFKGLLELSMPNQHGYWRCGYLDWRRLCTRHTTLCGDPRKFLVDVLLTELGLLWKPKHTPWRWIKCFAMSIGATSNRGSVMAMRRIPQPWRQLAKPSRPFGIPTCIPPRESWWPATIMANFCITVYSPIVQILSITRQNGFWVVLASRQLRLQTQWKEKNGCFWLDDSKTSLGK